MNRVLVTGAKGFIGRNLVTKLKETEEYQLFEFDEQKTVNELEVFVKQSDFIVHLAGSNRPQDISEYREVNFGLTEVITKILSNCDRKIPVIFSSSTQAELDNHYGISKKQAEDLLLEHAKNNGSKVFILRLTNVFGKWCRPNYNSVVATFCNNIANELPIQINDPNSVLKLVYIDDVLNAIINLMNIDQDKLSGFINVGPVYELNLGHLAEVIYSFKESRKNLVLPDVSDEFTKKLYSTYLSYLNKNDFKYELKTNTDNRGDLTELIKSEKFGQIFMSTTKPGITRGNHYHHTKTEKFIVIKGKAQINFKKIDEDEVISYEVCGDKIEIVDIPPGYTHNIVNIGDEELITLFWANEIFNPDKPDTKFLQVN